MAMGRICDVRHIRYRLIWVNTNARMHKLFWLAYQTCAIRGVDKRHGRRLPYTRPRLTIH